MARFKVTELTFGGDRSKYFAMGQVESLLHPRPLYRYWDKVRLGKTTRPKGYVRTSLRFPSTLLWENLKSAKEVGELTESEVTRRYGKLYQPPGNLPKPRA